MNIDKPLDDLIAAKKPVKSNNNNRSGAPAKGPRVSRDRSDAVPYSRPAPRSTNNTWVHDAFAGSAPGGGGGGRGQGGPFGQRGNNGPRTGPGGGVFTGISPRIEVVGLHYEVTPGDLKTIFSQAGTLVQDPIIRAGFNVNMDERLLSSSTYYLPSICIRLYLFSNIQYDRSGRSTGEASMEYSSVQEAKVALNKFDGAMTKGQTISIRFLPPLNTRQPPAMGQGGNFGAPRPAVNNQDQSGASLLARMTKTGGGGGAQAPRGAGPGPVRGRGGPVRGRGGPGRGASTSAPRKSGPPDAGNLDKELDAFMKTDSGDVAMA